MKLSKKTIAQLFGSVIGIIVIAFGVAIIVKASIGIDPWGVFFNAMQTVYMMCKTSFMPAISFGDSITIISIFIVIIASSLAKEKIKWLSIVGGVLLGQFVNVWSSILQIFVFPSIKVSLGITDFDIISMCMLFVGIFILSVGVAITIHYPFIMSPVDYLMYALDLKIKRVSYGMIRVISDVSITCVGALIIILTTGDTAMTKVGIGTVVMFLITGLVIDKVQQNIGKYVNENTK